MSQNPDNRDAITEISVDPHPTGLRAVYLVETRSPEEARSAERMFAELASRIQVKQLSKGKLVSFAVQASTSDSCTLDEVENVLKTSYAFVVTQRSFDEVIYRIVRELCQDTGSKVLSMSRCNICGRAEPFPNTVISLSDDEGARRMSRLYCSHCTAEAAAPTNKEFVRSLLAADRRDFGRIERAELVRRPSRQRPIRFRIKAEASQQL